MDDLIFIVILLACCAATGGFLVVCERLLPRESHGPKETKP